MEAANDKNAIIAFVGKGLGVLWIIDGLLQLQPKMFGMEFVNGVLAPNLAGQPQILRAAIGFGITLFAANPVVANLIAALLQLALGVLLFFPPGSKKFKAGLYLSAVWGAVVWIFGEGLGNLLAGSAGFYGGAPGAAALYGLIAALLLFPEKISRQAFSRLAALILFLGSLLQLQVLFWNPDGVRAVFSLSAADGLRVVATVPAILAAALAAHPIVANLLLLLLPLSLGFALLFRHDRMIAALGIIFLFFVWWFGQDFGGLTSIWTGTATDPNAAPLLMLLIAPLLIRERSSGS